MISSSMIYSESKATITAAFYFTAWSKAGKKRGAHFGNAVVYSKLKLILKTLWYHKFEAEKAGNNK